MSAPRVDPLAGKPAPLSLLANIPRLVTAYYTERPDPAIPGQRVAFGTSGHRGSSLTASFNEAHKITLTLWKDEGIALTLSPARAGCMLVGLALILLLYRSVTTLGRLTFVLWLGVLGVLAWVLIEGFLHFDPAVAFDFSGPAARPASFLTGLGGAMTLALYSYLGYYNICYVGDEVRDPAAGR